MLLLSLFAPPAAALDVDTFSFSSSAFDAQGGMQVESPTLSWPGAAYGGLGLVYAHDPLVQTFDDGTTESVVTDSFATRLTVGYTLLGRVRLGLDLPLYPYVGGAADAAFNGISSGDARLRAVFQLPLGDQAPVDLAVIPMISLPTGEPSAYTGTGGVGGGLAIAAGAKLSEKLGLVANLGYRANKHSELGDQTLGSGLDLGLGASYAVQPDLSFGVELDGTVDLVGGLGTWAENPFELHGYGRYGKASGIQTMLGLGTGLVGGVGAPDVRVIGGIGYRAPGRKPVYDIDKDGIFDDIDACVDVPEDTDGFEDSDGCPDTDNDKDGLADAADACPNDAEDIDAFEDTDGCPDPDNDQDGVLDPDDECPLEPGTVGDKGCPDQDADTLIDKVDACPEEAGPVNTQGCPDRDSDRVPDKHDKCPDQPADPRIDPPRSDGCARRVFVSVERIECLEKIFFDTGKTTIKNESYPLLAEIAAALNDNPDIQKIEVAGHTDSVGKDAMNFKLSRARAEAVIKHLTKTGNIDAARLAAAGYGETLPLETNATEAGRFNNRRVEFVIKAFERPSGPLGAAPPAN